MPVLFGLIGFVLGMLIDGIEAGLIFGFVAVVSAALLTLQRQVGMLDRELKRLRDALSRDWDERHGKSESTETVVQKAVAENTIDEIQEPVARDANEARLETTAWASAQSNEQKTSEPSYLQTHLIWPALQLVKNYFSQGNLFVRVGMLVLFFGVAFLLKYAAEHSVFPIELRISAVAMAAMAVLFVGWRLRAKNTTYGLILQGGSIGVLFMTIYAAYQMYPLIPSIMAFALMLLLAICSALLAVYQNARVLAVLATVGGFLAPVLA
ncbi:MAG: DUF2339 domain-containing protein, partial [Gammaproteobacteria bacterium]